MDECVGNDRDRDDDINAQHNQQGHGAPTQDPTRQRALGLGGALARFESAYQFGIVLHRVALLAQQVWEHRDHSIQCADQRDRDDDSSSGEVCLPSISQVSHNFCVVD